MEYDESTIEPVNRVYQTEVSEIQFSAKHGKMSKHPAFSRKGKSVNNNSSLHSKMDATKQLEIENIILMARQKHAEILKQSRR